jgi:hypothetical protein
LGLEAFGALNHFKLNFLIFLERFKPFPLDGGMMHKDIGAVFLRNEAKPFGIIEPFYLTLHLHVGYILLVITALLLAAASPVSSFIYLLILQIAVK